MAIDGVWYGAYVWPTILPQWDNLLLAYDRRERVLPESYRRVVIRKNGDVFCPLS